MVERPICNRAGCRFESDLRLLFAHGEALLVGELDPAMRAAVERSLAWWRRSTEEIQR